MSLTLAQRNQLRKRAAQEAAAAAPATSMAGATSYELQLAQLHQDRHRLKQIQSTEGKIELKRQLVPHYAPYIDGVLSAGVGAQDEVLTTLMLWRFDIADWDGALAIARYVLQHGLAMPDRFARTTGTLIAEEIADRVGIVNQGRLKFLGTIDDLRRQLAMHETSLEHLYLSFTAAERLEREAEGAGPAPQPAHAEGQRP